MNLKKGDLIGIVSPSSCIAAYCPGRLKRGVENLEKLGFKVKLGKAVSFNVGFTAGTPEQRVDDIHNMFKDQEVKAIIATIGGYNANDVLEKLDYDLIRKNNNKIFIGYSDISLLLVSLNKFGDVPTVMGPMVMPQFGELPEILDFSKESFLNVTSNLGSGMKYSLPASDKMTEEMLWWDKEDNRPRQMSDNEGWWVLNEGEAEGKLIAANLNTILNVAGTKFFPDLKDTILFLEDDEEENASKLQRMLQHLNQIDLKKEIKGIVFGRYQSKSEIDKDTLKQILDVAFKRPIPIFGNVDFGHTDPMLSLPLGKKVKVSSLNRSITVTL